MNVEARARALRLYGEAWRVTRELAELYDGGPFALPRVSAHLEMWLRRLRVAGAAYEGTLPAITLSRCPYTGDALTLAIDLAGLDGPWWNLIAPRRPLPVALPPTLVGFDGAVRLEPLPPPAPFPRRPGPQVPAVLPRLLQLDDVTAVCSSLFVGANPAWCIAYFARPGSEAPPPLNDWGADHYLAVLDDGVPRPINGGDETRDADLAPWIERERLCWIAPGDDALEVRRGLDGCPYVGLGTNADAVLLAPAIGR